MKVVIKLASLTTEARKRKKMKKKENALTGYFFLAVPLAFFAGVIYLIIYLL